MTLQFGTQAPSSGGTTSNLQTDIAGSSKLSLPLCHTTCSYSKWQQSRKQVVTSLFGTKSTSTLVLHCRAT